MSIGRIMAIPALAFAIGHAGSSPLQAQSTPVQPQQTPQQSEQAREQDRALAEDMKIGRDWKAQESGNDQAAPAASDKAQETVGRDWRAHPENRNR